MILDILAVLILIAASAAFVVIEILPRLRRWMLGEER